MARTCPAESLLALRIGVSWGLHAGLSIFGGILLVGPLASATQLQHHVDGAAGSHVVILQRLVVGAGDQQSQRELFSRPKQQGIVRTAACHCRSICSCSTCQLRGTFTRRRIMHAM